VRINIDAKGYPTTVNRITTATASAVTVGMYKSLAKTADFDKCEPLDLFFAIL